MTLLRDERVRASADRVAYHVVFDVDGREVGCEVTFWLRTRLQRLAYAVGLRRVQALWRAHGYCRGQWGHKVEF